MSNEIFIDGDTDTIQLRVQGNSTQTDPLQTWEDSAAQVLAQVDADGQLLVDGHQDQVQLRVQAHSAQTEPLQTWEKSDGTPLAQITADGRLELGALDLGTQDGLIEANQAITLPDTVTPRRGVQSIGQITGYDEAEIDGETDWSVHELELAGDAGVEGIHTALRAKITQTNTGDSDQAELRAGGFEVIIEGGGTQRVKEAVGIHSMVTNEQTGHLDQAVGVKVTLHDEGTNPIQEAYGLLVEDVDQGAQANYAIHTGAGTVHLGDAIEMPQKSTTPANPPSGARKLYPKDDGWYDLDNLGNESKIGSGAGGGSVTSVGLSLPGDVFDVSGSPVTDSGTLTATFDDQAANEVFAGPASGGAATPAFRALVAADIPSLTAAKISDFDTEVSDNTDVAANTAHRQTTSGNPHNVTASDVGNTTAQWNADQLQGRDVASTAPSDGQALVWDNANSQWEPGDVSGGVSEHYRSRAPVVRRVDNSKIAVSHGVVEVNATEVAMDHTTLDMATGSDWLEGSSQEAASQMVYIYLNAAGDLKLSNRAPIYPRANQNTMVFTASVNQAGWDGSDGSHGLNATSVVYDGDTGEANLKPGMRLGICTGADSDYSTWRGAGQNSSGGKSVPGQYAFIEGINTSTNTLTLRAGHNIAINDNDRLFAISGTPRYRYENSTWYRCIGAQWNDGSQNLVEGTDGYSHYECNESSDYTTTSQSWTYIDNTHLALTITTHGGDVLVSFHGVIYTSPNTSTVNVTWLDVGVDGVAAAGDDGIVAVQCPANGESRKLPVAFTRLMTGLSAGVHTFKLQWKVRLEAGATLYAGAGTGQLDVHPQFWVQEIA